MITQLFKAALTVSICMVVAGCALSNPVSYFSEDMPLPQQPALTQEKPVIVVPTPRPLMGDVTASITSSSAPGNLKSITWEQAYQDHEHRTGIYWDTVAEKRRLRNAKRRNGTTILLIDYVLTQPPVYDGPPRPVIPPAIRPPEKRKPVPGIHDFLTAAKRVYGFEPDRPHTESEFMRAYAAAAVKAGLTHSQLVALYAFETGGNGTHDLQSGMLRNKKDATPTSTAIGYNQLVATASVSVMSEFGSTIAAGLRRQAHYEKSSRRRQLLKKAAIIDKMTAQARTVPHQWQAQAKMARTPAGLGIHAMTLDKDIGPLLQIHKLRTSVRFLHSHGIKRHLSGSELEMLNLTGDGNGLDMVSMPEAYRGKVPTANFFLRNGYERNPIAKQNNTVAQLLSATDDRMQQNMQKEGAQALFQAFQALARH